MSAPKKHSIDQMIEHMTADNSDGQYVPLGFTPPPTPASVPQVWPDYSSQYLRQGISHLSDLHYGVDPSHILKQPDIHPNYYYAAHHQQINYNAPASYHMLPNDGQAEVSHPLGGFVPYHPANMEQRDYGLFGSASSEQHARQYQQPTVTNQTQLIENLVGNWVPTQTGTYSPFGCVDGGGGKPATNQQTTQTADMESEHRGVGRSYQRGSKQRAVAEVRPMRPSYSDVLTKSPPAAPVAAASKSSTGAARPDSKTPASKTPASKTSARKSKAGALKRQHSSGSEEHVAGAKPCEGGSKAGGGASEDMTARRWVSLEGLDSSSSGGGDKQVDAFQAEEVRPRKPPKKSHHESWDTASTLNNHKPSNGTGSKGASGGSKRPIQINNNLGPTSPWAHGPAAAHDKTHAEKNVHKRNCKSCADDKKGNSKGEAKRLPSCPGGRPTPTGPASKRPAPRAKRRPEAAGGVSTAPAAQLWRAAGHHAAVWTAWAVQAVAWFLHLLSDVLGMSCKLSLHMFGQSASWARALAGRGWARAVGVASSARVGARAARLARALRWWRRDAPAAPDDAFTGGGGRGRRDRKEGGLEHNMSLPATGEEAMKRLLSCKDKDPYSILGVAPHCSDEDVKRYYKRQAFLVHPDKNSQPGAEEAFKILVHAFELIGEPERRLEYERRVAETQQVAQAWSELSDLLSQLQQKMEYAANTIRCTNCGRRHRRAPVSRPCYAARSCAQCKIHHAAREGDIWAESSVLGLLWHYYACMDGAVYDITEWAACQADNLKHLRANTHNVQYRIVLGKQAGGGAGKKRASDAAQAQGEPDLEDFLNNLYSQSGASAGSGGGATGGGTSSEGGVKQEAGRGRKKTKQRKK